MKEIDKSSKEPGSQILARDFLCLPMIFSPKNENKDHGKYGLEVNLNQICPDHNKFRNLTLVFLPRL